MGQLLFKKCFLAAIVTGTKRTTIRRWSLPRVRAGERAFTPGVGWLIIDAVEEIELNALDEADARADGFESLAPMRRALRKLYPSTQTKDDDRHWFRVSFRFDTSVPKSNASASEQRRALVDCLRNPAPNLIR